MLAFIRRRRPFTISTIALRGNGARPLKFKFELVGVTQENLKKKKKSVFLIPNKKKPLPTSAKFLLEKYPALSWHIMMGGGGPKLLFLLAADLVPLFRPTATQLRVDVTKCQRSRVGWSVGCSWLVPDTSGILTLNCFRATCCTCNSCDPPTRPSKIIWLFLCDGFEPTF